MRHSQTGRRAGTPISTRAERWRHLRRWLTWRIPTHKRETT